MLVIHWLDGSLVVIDECTDEFNQMCICCSPRVSLSTIPVCVSKQQAFNATAVVRHMRRLQLGTSLEGPSQITPTSPCHSHLLPEEEEEEEEEGNEEEESCK